MFEVGQAKNENVYLPLAEYVVTFYRSTNPLKL